MKSNKRLIWVFMVITIIFLISHLLVRFINFSESELLNPNNLFTYFGVLLGFAITVYTFGSSMVSDIIIKTFESTRLSEAKKYKIQEDLFSAFKEIKEDIWIIFISLTIVIVFAILNEISNPFLTNVEEFKIPETFSLALFILSTYSMWDLIKTLFNIAEINFILSKVSK